VSQKTWATFLNNSVVSYRCSIVTLLHRYEDIAS